MKLNFKKIKIERADLPTYVITPLNDLAEYIDFEVKRIYFISKTAVGTKTASHCHKIEKELFVMASGSCTAVIDQGNGLEEIKMEAPDTAVYFGNYVWHHFKDFSENAVLVGISSTKYNPDRSDYIENYEEYKKVVATLE